MSDQNDISMLDVSDALDSISGGKNPADAAPVRRKSTLILTDEHDNDRMHVEQTTPSSQENYSPTDPKQPTQDLPSDANQKQAQHEHQPPQNQVPDPAINVPVEIRWVQGGDKVYVTGSFTGWRKMISLQKQPDNSHVVTIGLPVGTHRFRFVIDNELRFSDFLPTATDQMGNFVNYVEVTPEQVQAHLGHQSRLAQEQEQERQTEEQKTQFRGRSPSNRPRSNSIFGFLNDDDDMGDGYSRYYDEDGDQEVNNKKYNYINDIPPIFVEPKVMEQYYLAIDEQAKSKNGPQQTWLHPPQLPPQLDNVILNNFNSDRDNNSGALPIPNHVVLNHLATTSIKHNTLAVASVVRYQRKYVTQVLYAPLQQ